MLLISRGSSVNLLRGASLMGDNVCIGGRVQGGACILGGGDSAGAFNNFVGNHELSGSLTIAGSGDYVLSSGSLRTETIANHGTFSMSGGSLRTTTFLNLATFSYEGGEFLGQLENNSAVSLSVPDGELGEAGVETFDGNIAGSGRVVVSAESAGGRMVLNGDNSYDGGTNVESGVLKGDTDSLQGNIQTENGTGVVFDQTGVGRYDGVMIGGGALTKEGDGTLILTGVNSYTGDTVVAGGVLQGDTSSLQGDIFNDTQVVFDQESAGTYSGAMSGIGSLTKEGSGTVVLAAANSYAGGTNLNGGALSVSSEGNLGAAAGPLNFNGGILQVSGTTFARLGRPTTWGAAGGGFDIVNAGNTFEVSQEINGEGSVVKQGEGTLLLTANNNYGGTTIEAGVLQGDTDSLNGPMNIFAGSKVVFDQAGDGTFSDRISGSGEIAKDGAGTLTLGGTNSFSGSTDVVSGVLQGDTESLQGATIDIFEGAMLVFDQQGDNGRYSGSISGGGALKKLGDAELNLTGMNPFSGAIFIEAGVLGGDTESLQSAIIDIAEGATLCFDQLEANGSYSGSISGGGAFKKLGDTELELTGTNPFSGETYVEAGVLRGDTESLQGATIEVFEGATLVFDLQGENGVYGGSISGGGALVKLGDTELELTGTNPFSGDTWVEAGVLRGDTDSLQGATIGLAEGTTLVFDQDTDGQYNGRISGSGTLRKQGEAELTLLGDAPFGGTAFVDAGTLRGDAATLPSAKIEIAEGAALVFDQQTDDGSYSGRISGGGALRKQGDAALILGGENSYVGGTEVLSGVLQGDTTSLQGDIANFGTVVFDQSDTGIYDGTISGTGNLVKQGGGLLIFNGNSTYTGGTQIVAGNLQIGDAAHPGASILGLVTVGPNGTLSGHGTINGGVDNAGTIAPGGSIGTLRVAGNLVFQPGSTFQVAVTPDASSRLAVQGVATLGGAQVEAIAAAGAYGPTRYRILSAASIDGRFADDLISNFAAIDPLLVPSLTYDARNVYLELQPTPLDNPMGPGVQFVTELVQMIDRMATGRFDQALGDLCPKTSLGIWARGFGMVSSASAKGDDPGYDGDAAGLLIGLDGQITDRLSLGMMGFTAAVDVDADLDYSNLTSVDLGGFNLYAAYTRDAWQLRSILGYSDESYSTRQSIGSGAQFRRARGSMGARRISGYSEGSYTFKSGGLSLQPILGLQYGWLEQDDFTQKGLYADGQGLKVSSRSQYLFDTLLGGRFRFDDWIGKNTKIQAEARALYMRRFGDLDDNMDGTLSNGTKVSVRTQDRPGERDGAVLGAGLTLLTDNGFNFYMDYNGQFLSGRSSSFFSAGLRYVW